MKKITSFACAVILCVLASHPSFASMQTPGQVAEISLQETNNGSNIDRTEENRLNFPNCLVAAEISGSPLQGNNYIGYRIDVAQNQNLVAASIFFKETNGRYRSSTGYSGSGPWMSTGRVTDNSDYDFDRAVGSIRAIIIINSGRDSLPVLPTPTGTSSYSPSGQWSFKGTGLVHGDTQATDEGVITFFTRGSVGSEFITRFECTGVMEFKDTGERFSYTAISDLPMTDVYSGVFVYGFNDTARRFIQLNERTMTATGHGRHSDTGYLLDFQYTVEKLETPISPTNQPSSGGGSGGGCNTGFAPIALLALLAVPLWGLRRYNGR